MIDIVIVNFNSTDYVLNCIKSVFDSLSGIPAHIFVLNNDSRGDGEKITVSFPSVSLTRNQRNLGFAKAVNQGIKQGTSPYIVLLNPDTLVGGDFFRAVLTYIVKNPDVGIVGPKILDGNGSVQGSARGFPTPSTAFFGRTSLLTKCFPQNRFSSQNLRTTRSDGVTPMEVDWVSGACMLVRREAIEDVGLLDEGFFLYWEDADWCKRMWESGWKVVYFPQASVLHLGGKSAQEVRTRSLVEFHRSAYRLFAKYASGPERLLKPVALWALALRLLVLLVWNGLHYIIQANRTETGKGRLTRSPSDVGTSEFSHP